MAVHCTFRHGLTEVTIEAADIDEAFAYLRTHYSVQFARNCHLTHIHDLEINMDIDQYKPKNRAEKAATVICVLLLLATMLFLIAQYTDAV